MGQNIRLIRGQHDITSTSSWIQQQLKAAELQSDGCYVSRNNAIRNTIQRMTDFPILFFSTDLDLNVIRPAWFAETAATLDVLIMWHNLMHMPRSFSVVTRA